MSKRSIHAFLGSLVLVTWGVQVVAYLVVGDFSSPEATPWLITTMFLPTIWVLLYRFCFRPDALRGLAWKPGNPIFLIAAALVPPAIAMTVVTIVVVLGWGTCGFFSVGGGTVEVLKGPWLLGTGPQSWPKFAANLSVTGAAFGLINSTVAVGEEFCWRGFLQPRMIDRFGTTRGVALLGLAWALWHLPANLAGYNHPESPILGALILFPLTLVAASFIMAWLTIRGRSFWPAVLFHGSINGMYEGVLSQISLNNGMSRLRVDALVIGVSVLIGVLCGVALLRRG